MGLHDDLLATATAAAEKAKAATTDGDGGVSAENAQAWGQAAKTALEAASLVGPAMTPDEISGALNELTRELEEAGVFDEAQRLAPVDFLRAVLRGVVGLRDERAHFARRAGAFDALEGHVSAIAAEISQAADERRAPADDPGRRLANRMLSGVETIKMQAGIPHQ
jgi:hypothetical protein